MLPKNSRHVLYALLLIVLSVVCTSTLANANTTVFTFISETVSNLETSLKAVISTEKSAARSDLSTGATTKNSIKYP